MSNRCRDILRGGRELAPLILLSVLIAFLATASAPASTQCLFQSPVSPLGAPEGSPTVAQGTVEGPALIAVPAPPNFVPWVIGLLVTVIVVGGILYWRRKREGGEGSE